jgi:hypothetical protein
MRQRIEFLQLALGRVETRQLNYLDSFQLADHEYKVFSQAGEDGIIQFLLRHVQVECRTFVELGVEDYVESNTRFLLVNNNWQGLVIDNCTENVDAIKCSRAYWSQDLKALRAFITAENINDLIGKNGFTGDIGLLSIDIDGNDYWIWSAIDIVSPVIVIVEYNYRFGSELAVTIPYDEKFERVKAHPSRRYFGASLSALCSVAKRKGYVFVGCGTNGVNAFFVRSDRKPENIRELTPQEGYVAGNIAETLDEQGRFDKLSLDEEMRLLLRLPLVHVEAIPDRQEVINQLA